MVGSRPAEASRPFKPVTRLKCEACHKSTDEANMTDKDLTPCGTKSYDLLKKAGYAKAPKGKENPAEQKEWAQKALKGFKCE